MKKFVKLCAIVTRCRSILAAEDIFNSIAIHIARKRNAQEKSRTDLQTLGGHLVEFSRTMVEYWNGVLDKENIDPILWQFYVGSCSDVYR